GRSRRKSLARWSAPSGSIPITGSGSIAAGRRGRAKRSRRPRAELAAPAEFVRDTASMQRNAELRSLLDRFAGARIAVVGDLVADEYLYGETDRVSREAPVLIVRYESSDLKLGCAANAVANLCALGARVSPVGLVGEDLIGERLRELLREAGAGVDGVLTASGLPTATKTRV